MPPLSDSISSTSLPFGVDNHIHASLRRSGSLPRYVHHGNHSAIYNHHLQTHSTLLANSHGPNPVSHTYSLHIPPSSIHSIPRSHKKVLRRYRVLFWVVIGVFNISLIALTAAVVLGAIKAHQESQNAAKCAAIIVGVFGFSGIVGSAAVIWFILIGRRERARLEKRWAEEERVKEARGMRERLREAHIRESIKERERSLSRSQSRGRGRERTARPAVAKKPSHRAMTPAPPRSRRRRSQSASSSSEKRDSLLPRPLNISKDNLGHHNAGIDEKSRGQSHERGDNDDRGKDKNYDHDRQHEGGKAQVTRKIRDSALTQIHDTEPPKNEIYENEQLDAGSRLMIATLNEECSSEPSPRVDESEQLPAHLEDSAFTSPMPLNTSSTYVDSSSSTDHASHPDPLTSYHSPLSRLPPRRDSTTPAITTTTTDLPPHPNNTSTAVIFSRTNNHTNNEDEDEDEDENEDENEEDDDESPPPSPPRHHIPRLNHGGLGSAQSDDNFRDMLHHGDDRGLASEEEEGEDERVRRERR